MSPFKCFVCFQASTKCPQSFEDVLIEFIRAFSKFQSCSEVTDFNFCQSCWIYLMRIHQFDHQLSLKKKLCGDKIALLSTKIRRAPESLQNSGNNLKTCEHLEGGVFLASEINEENDAENFLGQTQEGENKSMKAASVDDNSDSNAESDSAETDDLTFAYANNWAPKHLTIPKSPVVKRLSEIDFIYKKKFPFQATDGGFQCGLCTAICPFSKSGIIWKNMYSHFRTWHTDGHKVRAQKVYQRFVEVAPNHFQYGKNTAEWIDGNYRCGECGVFKVPKPGCKNANIITHIINHHQKPSRNYVCEYCGKVYLGPNGLRVHKISKHQTSDRQFPCDDCGKIFVCRIKAYYHQRKAHGIKQKFICEICGKDFKENQILRTHVDIVHNVQKIKCKDCDKVFGSQMALRIHRYSHTGKKFTCDICGMDFTQGYSVTRHKKTAHLQ